MGRKGHKSKSEPRSDRKRPSPVNADRRSFLKTFAWVSGGAVVWGTLADTAGLSPWIKLGSDKARYGLSIPEATHASAKALFGIRQHHTSIVPAASNPTIRKRLMQITSPVRASNREEMLKYFSKATVDASAFLQPLLHDPVVNHFVGYDEVNEILRANRQESIVALGTPTSNSLIRNLMTYREYEDPADGHEYQANDAIQLPILFELRRRQIVSADNQRDAWYRPQSFAGEPVPELIPNWGITTAESDLLLPATDGQGRLLEDFLVISSLPNVLRPESVERRLPVICIGGTHSVGTLALKDVLEDPAILPGLEQELRSKGSPDFWQALIRVELNPESGKPVSLFLERKFVQPVEVNQSLLMQVASTSTVERT